MVDSIHQQNHYSRNHFSPQNIRHVNNNTFQRSSNRLIGSNSPISTLAYKGFGDLSKTLSNVDQVVKVLRSATPIIHEYGPMIKNLPAMYRMVKALGQTDDDKTPQPDHINDYETKSQSTQGQSTPKLYI